MPRKKSEAAPAAVPTSPIVAYKGFDANFECRGYRFAVGRTEKHDGPVVACESGFHACEHPLDVFGYYPPATSRFAVVELGGDTARHGSDTKIAAAEITIRAEIQLPEMIAAAIKYVTDRVTWTKGPIATGEREGARETADGGAATASGVGGAATASGRWGAATASGWWGAATASGVGGAATASGVGGAATASGVGGAATASGWWGAATASGTRGAATASGDGGAATASGWQGAATASGVGGAATASGWRGAATASGWRGAATASGERGAATASGDGGAATASGTRGAATASGVGGAATATGKGGIAIASGPGGTARGDLGCDLVLREFDSDGNVIARWIGTVGNSGIKPGIFYRLVDGKPVKADEDAAG